MTFSEYVPAVKLVPLIVKVAVAGNELTDTGLMLQLPEPKVVGQLKVTVPVNPSCAVIEIGPLIPVLPTFTSGKALGSVRTKSEFAVTTRVNEVVSGDGAPAVEA